MPGLVCIDLLEHSLTDRILDLVHDELDQGSVERHLEHRYDGPENRERQTVGMLVQPVDDELDVDVGLGHLVAVQHSPPTHQREFGVGVLLFLGVEMPIDVSESFSRRLESHRSEATGTDVLDPHQVRHERFQLRMKLWTDRLGARSIPVDVHQSPLAVLDLVQHAVEIEGHVTLLSCSASSSPAPPKFQMIPTSVSVQSD